MVQPTRSSSGGKNSNVGDNANPLKSDPELVGLLRRLDKVKKYKTFNRWKSKFLGRLGALVYEKGMDPAENSCNEFASVLKLTVKCAGKVTRFIEQGDLSATKKTVKAQMALSELTKDLTIANEKLEELIPGTGREEKKMGYTKFHLGAVLIRQGFHQYITMTAIDDLLMGMGEELKEVADRQQLELFQYYKVKLQRFCDIMADLGLYAIMMKCVEFQEAPGEEESSDEEPMKICIDVEDAKGKKRSIHLEVEPSDKIGDIKNMIAEDIGMEPDKQVIKLKGKELPDDMSMAKAGVKDGSTLTVESLKVPITVQTYDGKEIKLLVDPDEYLSNLKRMLEPESGISPANQVLYNKDNGNELLDNDNDKLQDCNIHPGTTLYLEPSSMTLHVEMPNGQSHVVPVSPSDTADDVKAKIAQQTGTPAPEQVLKLPNGKELPLGKKLSDLGLSDGDTIHVESIQIPLTVQTPKDGKEYPIMVSPNDTLGDIKRQLQDKTGLPVDMQLLSSKGGTPLDKDSKTVAELGLATNNKGVLTLEPKAMTITITLPDGTSHKLEVDALDKSDHIQNKISKSSALKDLLAVTTKGTIEIHTAQVFSGNGSK